MIMSTKEIIFWANVGVNYLLLLGVVTSIGLPKKRVWPPPRRQSWQYVATWALFYAALLSNALLIVLDWNSWIMPDEFRFFVGVPATVIGGLLVTWGIMNLGITNTYGLRDGFVQSGPYRYTRNPQYLGDIILFIGISLISNSLYVLVVHILMIVVFMFAPFYEETWLEAQYGEEYKQYKEHTTRFL